jgi:quercetin dioxygenase-like cupin family protein
VGWTRLSASSVHFTPGARTAWHTHPNGQTIYVLEGVGLCQARGGPIEVIRPGDRVFFEPGEEHWHGAAATRFMTHLAMLEADDDGNTATWGDHVSDEEYAAAPGIEGRESVEGVAGKAEPCQLDRDRRPGRGRLPRNVLRARGEGRERRHGVPN